MSNPDSAPKSSQYRRLDCASILETTERLCRRIGERFPERGLVRVCGALVDTARSTRDEIARLAAPNWPLRLAVAALIAACVVAQLAALRSLHFDGVRTDLGLIQTLEAVVNLLILFGGAVWFLITLEERVKRRRTLEALHQLRSLAHVIDMHQLTKDPSVLLAPVNRTPTSPEHAMSRFELTRYLDYCAEMQALVGKLAALYAEGVRDAVVIDAINDIENLAANLGRKIWQKIMILSALEEGA